MVSVNSADLSSKSQTSLGWEQATVAGGTRSTSAAYLTHTRDNIHVLLNTHVTRILPVEHGDHRDRDDGPNLRKVELASSAEGRFAISLKAPPLLMSNSAPRRTVTATKEIVLSAGVMNTPQILLNSGIGSKIDLEWLGIKTIIDNPSVGQNFSDQVSISINFTSNLAVTE